MDCILGYCKAEEKRHAWNDTHRYFDIASDRCLAELGLFEQLGIRPWWRSRRHSDHRYHFGPDGKNITVPVNEG
jgi:hypothetical protein